MPDDLAAELAKAKRYLRLAVLLTGFSTVILLVDASLKEEIARSVITFRSVVAELAEAQRAAGAQKAADVG